MRAFVVEELGIGALRALNYSPTIERIRRAGSNSARPLHDIVKIFGPGWRRAFARRPCDPKHGVEFLSQGDVFAAEPRGQAIRVESMSDPRRYRIDAGQIVLAATGTLGENELYGQAILADNRLSGKYLTEDAMALVLNDPCHDFSLFAYAWLASPTGVQVLRSTSYGTKLLRFRKDLLRSIPVPEAPRDVVARVAGLIRRCVSGREEYARAIGDSRRLVEGSPDVMEALECCNGRSRRSVVWNGTLPTLCAWNFAAGGGIVELLQRRWGARLRDAVEQGGIFLGPRSARIPCTPPHGVQLYSQRDVFMIRPIGQRVARMGVSDRMLRVPDTGLLVAANGQMNEGSLFGKVELASLLGSNAGITGHIMRILPRARQREFLYAFLSTLVGQWLMKSTAVGTSVPSMRPDLLANLPIPDPGVLPMNEIKPLVSRAESARFAANQAEAEAVRIIEEEVLPQWLA